MSKYFNHFTKEEDEFIIANYKKITGAEIARKLGRHKSAIYYRAKKLGLSIKIPNRGDLTGQKFNMLTVTSLAECSRTGLKRWLCKCDCGNEKAILATHLVRGKIKSCGCLQKRKASDHPNFNGYKEIHLSYFNNIKNNAKKRNRKEIPFEITIEYIWKLFAKQKRRCALSGMPIHFPETSTGWRTASLDRIDSSKGYIIGNVQWLHKDVNMMKGSYTNEYFLQICEKVTKKQLTNK